MKLKIRTDFPEAVRLLLLSHQLIERSALQAMHPRSLDIDYPDDSLSQAMFFWLALAQGCGMISRYTVGEE